MNVYDSYEGVLSTLQRPSYCGCRQHIADLGSGTLQRTEKRSSKFTLCLFSFPHLSNFFLPFMLASMYASGTFTPSFPFLLWSNQKPNGRLVFFFFTL